MALLKLNQIALFCAVMCMAACGSNVPPPPEYSGSDAAHVKFVEKLEDGAIYLYPENDCNGGAKVVSSSNANGGKVAQHMIDPLPEGKFDLREMSVAPGKTVNIGFFGYGVHGFLKGETIEERCVAGLSFVAGASTQYEIVHKGADALQHCHYEVNRLEYVEGKVLSSPVQNIHSLICKGK